MDKAEHNRRRALQEYAATQRIATILAKKECKLLRPGQVRIAASRIFRGVTEAKAASHQSMTDLRNDLATRMHACGCHADPTEPYRIHRWMIDIPPHQTPAQEEVIRQKVKSLSKTTSTYLQLIGVLAEIAGRDPFDAQYEMIEALDLLEPVETASPSHDLPEQNLALRLQEFAGVVARDLDLVGYFHDCQTVQPRLDLHRDLLTPPWEDNWPFGMFWARERLPTEGWLAEMAPPLPSVRIARIPYRYLSGPFELKAPDGFKRQEDGHAVAYWDMFLTVAPSGPNGVGFWLLRSSSVDLTLNGLDYFLGHQRDDIEVLLDGHDTPPPIFVKGRTWQVITQQQPFPEMQADDAEEFPSFSIPRTDILPLNAASIRKWLLHPRLLVVSENIYFETIDLIESEAPFSAGWITAACLARSVERAMRDGRIRAALSEKLQLLRPQITTLKAEWLDGALAADAALRAKYQHDDLGDPK